MPEPVPKQRAEVSVDGIRIAYQVSGNGPPLACCHAMGWDHTLWDNARSVLSDTHTVVTFDQRGAGESDHPQNVEGEDNSYTVDTFADDLEAVLDHAGLRRASIVGYSMGAVPAIRFASRSPERVERLILASAMASRLPEAIIERARAVERMVETEGMARTYEFYFSGPLFAGVTRTDAFNREMEACAAWATPHGFLGCFGVTIDRPSMVDDLHKISAPTLIMVGEHDIHYLEEADLLASRIPRTRKTIMANAGHAMIYEVPEAFVGEIGSFLS